jgi:hypothetical protein
LGFGFEVDLVLFCPVVIIRRLSTASARLQLASTWIDAHQLLAEAHRLGGGVTLAVVQLRCGIIAAAPPLRQVLGDRRDEHDVQMQLVALRVCMRLVDQHLGIAPAHLDLPLCRYIHSRLLFRRLVDRSDLKWLKVMARRSVPAPQAAPR